MNKEKAEKWLLEQGEIGKEYLDDCEGDDEDYFEQFKDKEELVEDFMEYKKVLEDDKLQNKLGK